MYIDTVHVFRHSPVNQIPASFCLMLEQRNTFVLGKIVFSPNPLLNIPEQFPFNTNLGSATQKLGMNRLHLPSPECKDLTV